MPRLLRLAAPACLFAVLATVLLSPQVGQATITPGDPPPSCHSGGCSCGRSPAPPCPPQWERGASFVSLTEAYVAEEYSVAKVRSAFGVTLDFQLTYDSDNADGSGNGFSAPGSSIDTVVGYGWTHTYNDLLFSQHAGDIFRLGADGRITRFALQSNGSYQTSPGYFETLVKNNDGSFDLTDKYHTDYHYATVPGTPFGVDGPVFRLISVTDRNQNVTNLTYDANGNLITITDTYGRSISLNYNSNHHLVSVTDPLGNATTFTYNAAGNQLVTITDPNNKTTTYTYNNLRQITSKVDRDGRQFTFLYQNNNLPSAELDSAGNPLWSLSNTTNWALNFPQMYQTFMRVFIPSTTSKTDGRGNVWQYSYDSNAHPLTVTAPDGTITTYTYDPVTLQVATLTDADGNTTSYTYDTQGNMLTRTDALGHVTTYTYDSMFSQLLSMTDPQGRVTTYTIDSHGNRLTETDPLHKTASWTYDAHGNVMSSTDKDGFTTTYNYDTNGNLITVTDPLNEITSYTNDIIGNRLSMTDADGNLTKYQYDPLYRLTLITDALQHTKQYYYDGEGDKIEFVDENGDASSYAYDLRQRLVTVTDALGGTIRYTYDGNNNKLTITDQNGHTTTYTYDVQNRLMQVKDPLNFITSYTYDPVSNLTSETDANGHTTSYLYDQLNRRKQITDALGEVTTWNYDMTGLGNCPIPPGPCSGPTLGSNLVTKRTDGNGKVIYYAYDGLDRLIVEDHKQFNTNYEIDPNDAVTIYTYDPNSNRLSWQQPDGNVMDYTYDKVNRQLTMVQVQTGDTTTYTYDPFGNVKTVTAPNLNLTTYTYDVLNRRISATDSDGPVSTTSYDAVGNVIGSTDGDGNLTTYNYDALDRRITMTDPLDKMTQYSYDPVGNLLRVLDRNGNPTTYTYDADNRRITITDAQPATTTFQYDPVGNLTALIDANNHTTSFTYDKVNRKLTETYPDLSNNTITWTYDNVGNVLTRTDQKAQLTTYAYSDLYFLLSRSYPSGVDSFTYDLSGRVLTGNTTRGFGWNETFQYDGSDRLIQSVQNSKTTSYVYNIPGRTRTLTYPGGRNIVEQKDFRDFRLVNVNDGTQNNPSQTPIVQYTYDFSNNPLTRGYRNSAIQTSNFNPNNWVCSITDTVGTQLIVGFTYAYDNEGNKFYEQKLHELGRSEAYTYDSVYRLINYQVGQLTASPPPNCPGSLGVQNPVTQTSYNLDLLGNWNSKDTNGVIQTRTHSPSNEITAINAAPVVSDFDGNTTMYGTSGYSYDEENRLIKAVSGPLGTTVGKYQYDVFGRRVSKIDNFGNQTLYYYDGWRTIEEQNVAGVTQATYVFGNYLDEGLTMDRGGHTYYYHQNALWSVFALTNSSGAGVEGYYYDAYGYQTVVLPGTDGILDFGPDDVYVPGAPSSVGNPFLFTSQRFDPETGLLYYKNRHDSTFFGRFMQRDPLDYDSRDPNLYEYTGDEPTRYTDDLGMLVHCVEGGFTFTYGAGGGLSWSFCHDDCTNWAVLQNARASAGLDVGASIVQGVFSGCLNTYIAGNQWDLTIGRGPVTVGGHLGTGGAGSGIHFGLGVVVPIPGNVGVSGGYTSSTVITRGPVRACPCTPPVPPAIAGAAYCSALVPGVALGAEAAELGEGIGQLVNKYFPATAAAIATKRDAIRAPIVTKLDQWTGGNWNKIHGAADWTLKVGIRPWRWFD